MADERHTPAPPAGEHIHMPGPSLLPIVNAAALALAIVCVTISIPLMIAALIAFFVSTAIWIVKAREEFNELPAEHAGGH